MFNSILSMIKEAIPEHVMPDQPLWRINLGRRRFTPATSIASYPDNDLVKDRAVRRMERWQRANPDADWADIPTHIKHNFALATNAG